MKTKVTKQQAAAGRGHKVSEGAFQRELEIALNEPTRATRAWRQNSGSLLVKKKGRTMRVLLAPKGSGDLFVLVRGGLHVEVETKAKGGKLRAAQKRRAEWLNSWGAIHVAVWPEVDDLRAAVRLAVARIDQAIGDRMKVAPPWVERPPRWEPKPALVDGLFLGMAPRSNGRFL